eukprot:3339658-Lingulodinium_polyedra.AAC.1
MTRGAVSNTRVRTTFGSSWRLKTNSRAMRLFNVSKYTIVAPDGYTRQNFQRCLCVEWSNDSFRGVRRALRK